ncbi:hypothetical protein D7W79_04935 [Corallococcus exercitus]|uniref:hypothetical protein n=1 Tax=Corallococcus exercitus TaxID=2316736 RepID=UPI000EA3A27B|nr:hypothetical protein [Corallococcus exercitus]RKG81633.1 hypothetical protein D7W79_04935 [Corallococcus exercitus]
MSISSLNRASFSQPLSSPSQLQPAAVAGTQAQQPRGDLRRMLMTDSFEQGPGRVGGASGDFEKQLAQAVSQLSQLVQALEVPSLGDLGEDAQVAAPKVGGAGGAAPTASAAAPAHPTYNSDAGPGFGPPSAGSTEPAPANAPWLAKNNVGSPYNSNMQLIDPGQKDQFKYTNTFTNNTNAPRTITLWNKTGENGNPNDGQNFDKSTPKTFTLQPGQSQVVAFDSNSSVAWCASKDGSAKPGANSGQTWGEATFANSGTGWSGYDTSQISPAGHNGKMSITNEATGKTVTEANAWQTEKDDPAGHDVGVPAGPLNLKTELG